MQEETDNNATVFVRNLPSDWVDNDLEKEFESIGPVKRGFVITDKFTSASKSFGFVVFAVPEDALEAVNVYATKKIAADRLLKVEMASKPGTKKEIVECKFKPERKAKPMIKKPRTPCSSKMILISHLPTDITTKRLYKRIKKAGDLVKLVHPAPEGPSCARAVFESNEIASDVVKKLDAHILCGETIHLRCLDAKACRLIFRNLSFKCTEELFRKHVSKVGEIRDLKFPLDANNKTVGFAFVQYDDPIHAITTLSTLNGVKIAGKPVIIDWALSKNAFQHNQQLIDDEKNNEEEKEEIDGKDEVVIEKKKPKPKVKTVYDNVDAGTTVFVQNIALDTTEEELVKFFSSYGKVRYARLVMRDGNSRGTAFVQFSSKDAVNSLLLLCPQGGSITHSILASEIQMNNRQLVCSLALSRDDAKEGKKKNAGAEDKRRLYLAREGLILPDSEAGRALPPSDRERRLKLWQETKTKLANPNFIISNTRLSVHNLPLTIVESQLSKLFLSVFSDDSTPTLKQVKIVRNENRSGAEEGTFRSKRFGFVEFESPNDALHALRAINNNPTLLPKTRLIVSFALEDQRKLFIRNQRQLKQLKQNVGKDTVPPKLTKKRKQESVGKAMAKKAKSDPIKTPTKKLKQESVGKAMAKKAKSDPIKTPTKKLKQESVGKAVKKAETDPIKTPTKKPKRKRFDPEEAKLDKLVHQHLKRYQ